MNGKTNEKMARVMEYAVAKDGRTPYAIAKSCGLDRGSFYRIKKGRLMPKVYRFLKIKKWMSNLGIDLEKYLYE